MPSYSYPKLELKYCERCGGLWLRLQGSAAVYCAACADAIRELPQVPHRGGGTPPGAIHAVCPVAPLSTTILEAPDRQGGACA